MRIAFAGTPEFACTALQSLQAAGLAIPLVLSQPDRPAGRGLKLQHSPVKHFALEHGLAVAQPRGLRLDGKYPQDAAAARSALQAARPDLLVVAAYGLILPQWVLDLPRLGCLNIHASLLPRWRGAAPIHRAIEAGDVESGVTIMQMDAGLDTGDMLLVERIPIAPVDTTGSLQDKLAALGARLVLEAIELAGRGGLRPVPQPATGATYARKIEKSEAAIDWSQPAEVIERRLRAFDPFPGATAVLAGETLKVWRSALETPAPSAGVPTPGTILAVDPSGIAVACGTGALRLTELQRPGGKRLRAAPFLQGFAVEAGMQFELP